MNRADTTSSSVEGPDRRVAEDVSGNHFDHVGEDQGNQQEHEEVAGPLRELVDGADNGQIAPEASTLAERRRWLLQ